MTTDTMITVNNLNFKQFYPGKFNASLKIDNLVLSVSHGQGCYGSGPSTPGGPGTYEVAMWWSDSDDWVNLADNDDGLDQVLGWQTDEDVNQLIVNMQNGVYNDK